MLADRAAFTSLIAGAERDLPRAPEAEPDPKRTLSQIYDTLKIGGARGDYYRFFGENIGIERLRRLAAFRRRAA